MTGMREGAPSAGFGSGGWDFYADPVAVGKYIAYRAGGLSRNSIIEEPVFLELLDDVSGRDCLDLGCGHGHYAELLAARGARVIAVDRAPLMLAAASTHEHPGIEYVKADIEEVEFPAASLDIIISNLTFHYIDDIGTLFQHTYKWLRPGGQFLFSVEHPIYTAAISQEHWADDNQPHRKWVVSDYFSEGKRWGYFGRKYHHTLQTWIGAALAAGFAVTAVREPAPPSPGPDLDPPLGEDEHRPPFLLVACRKPGQPTGR